MPSRKLINERETATGKAFLRFCRDLYGKRVFKQQIIGGYREEIEMPKYILFWSGYNIKEIYAKFSVIKDR